MKTAGHKREDPVRFQGGVLIVEEVEPENRVAGPPAFGGLAAE